MPYIALPYLVREITSLRYTAEAQAKREDKEENARRVC